ncbi:unnamed protein product [Rhizophagus irregularis]|nr:unnamed protein product [Rhizophagus irregularis]
MTPTRKEYLYKLVDLSENFHTANYVAQVVGEIIEKIGSTKILAIVFDNAANVRNARVILQEKYPNIENVRCIMHAVSLIACDIVKESFSDRLLQKVNILGSFFKSSHQAGAKLTQLIKENNIRREAILALEFKSATLRDYFLSLIRLSAVLKKLPRSFSQNFRNHCFNVMNERFKEFDDDKYITCFFLDPQFRNKPLKDKTYSRIMRCATTIGKRLGFNLKESRTLCKQIKDYRDASCERGFSTLSWLFNDQRLNLNISRLESMSKMIMHWKSNAKTELGFYGIEKNNTRISETEMNIRIAEALVETNDNNDDECDVLSNESSSHQITVPPDNCIVLIEDIWIDKFIDLSHELVIKEIREIPDDILDDSDDEYEKINDDCDDDDYDDDNGENDDKNESEGRENYFDYNVKDLLDEFIEEVVD